VCSSDLLHLIRANLLSIAGEVAAAEVELRKLIAADPGAEPPVRMLYNLLRTDGRAEAADQLLQEALAARPESFTLQWMQAGALEARGDIDGAIAVYEGLYARNSSDVVVANNLASLLTAHRDDAASLERAYTIARRLRGTEVPAFQDTYGWIAYRRGNLDEALAQLEPAARVLARDPMVQFHLGMVYAGLKRDAEARATLGRAMDLAGDSPLPQFATARDTLKALEGGTTGTGGQP
jgi:predicted Zn-dependent protease